MHIPDGWLSPPVLAASGGVALVGLTWATRRARRELRQSTVPLMGVMGAFVFAAQMINLPLPGGISGHLLGGTLLAITLGPAAATLVIASVLLLQALLFADGGLLAFGANFLNMGLVGTLGGYLVYRAVRALLGSVRGLYVGAWLGAWLSTVAGSALAALEIGLSGTADLAVVTAATVTFHLAIGLLEGLLTVSVVRYLVRARPELFGLEGGDPHDQSGRSGEPQGKPLPAMGASARTEVGG